MLFICREKISNEIFSSVQEQICSYQRYWITLSPQFHIVTPFSSLINSSASTIPGLLVSRKTLPKTSEGHWEEPVCPLARMGDVHPCCSSWVYLGRAFECHQLINIAKCPKKSFFKTAKGELHWVHVLTDMFLLFPKSSTNLNTFWCYGCFLKANSVPQLPSTEKQCLILSHSYAKSKQTFSCVSLLLAVLLFTSSSFSCCNLSNFASKGSTCSSASWKIVGKSSFYFNILVKINNFSSSKQSNMVTYFFFVCIKKRKYENMYLKNSGNS